MNLPVDVSRVSCYQPVYAVMDIDEKHDVTSGSDVTPRRPYRRYRKPPYSYVGLVAAAILRSPDRRLTLHEIVCALREMFAFFAESTYTGWRDSVRHNLSQKSCFVRLAKSGGWSVDAPRLPATAFRRQKTAVSQQGAYAGDLFTQLGWTPSWYDVTSGDVMLGDVKPPVAVVRPQDGRDVTATPLTDDVRPPSVSGLAAPMRSYSEPLVPANAARALQFTPQESRPFNQAAPPTGFESAFRDINTSSPAGPWLQSYEQHAYTNQQQQLQHQQQPQHYQQHQLQQQQQHQHQQQQHSITREVDVINNYAFPGCRACMHTPLQYSCRFEPLFRADEAPERAAMHAGPYRPYNRLESFAEIVLSHRTPYYL